MSGRGALGGWRDGAECGAVAAVIGAEVRRTWLMTTSPAVTGFSNMASKISLFCAAESAAKRKLFATAASMRAYASGDLVFTTLVYATASEAAETESRRRREPAGFDAAASFFALDAPPPAERTNERTTQQRAGWRRGQLRGGQQQWGRTRSGRTHACSQRQRSTADPFVQAELSL